MTTDTAPPNRPPNTAHARDDVATRTVLDALRRRGVDPGRLTSRSGTVPVVLEASDGGWIELTPIVPGSDRGGWAYTRRSAHGDVIDTGGHTAPALDALLVSLRSHLEPLPYPAPTIGAVERLRALCNPHRIEPFALHPASPAARWILALFLAWTDLHTSGDEINDTEINSTEINSAEANGSDITDRTDLDRTDLAEIVDLALRRIGLGDEVSLNDLATRIGDLPVTGVDHPAVAVIATHLLQVDRYAELTDATGAVSMAREITESLALDGHLTPSPPPPTHPGARPNNEDRAGWAVAALDALTTRSGGAPLVHRDPTRLKRPAIDLIAALLHLTDRAGLEPEQVLDGGQARHLVQAHLEHDPQTCTVPGCHRCDRSPTSTTGAGADRQPTPRR